MSTINRIHNILKDEVFEERFAIDGEFLIDISLCKIYNLDVWLVGHNENIYVIINMLKNYGLRICGVLNNNYNSNEIYGISVKRIDEMQNIDCSKSFFFFLSNLRKPNFLDSYSGIGQKFVQVNQTKIEKRAFNQLKKKFNIVYYHIFNDEEYKIITTNTADIFDAQRIEYYKNHENEICEFAKILKDKESIDTLCEYLQSYMQNFVYTGQEIQTNYKYWFDFEGNNLYKHLDNEYWINCGASVGDTIFSFLSWNFNFKRILAFEGSETTFKTLQNNISLLPREYKDKISLHNCFIDDSGEYLKGINELKCTLLNADIEGNELEMLMTMEDVIIRDRPVIAICLYHKKEDIVEIPKYLTNILTEYTFKLRKYTAWIMNFNRNHELVLYAIPNERNI